MPSCPRCGRQNSPGAEFCGYCGQSFAPTGAQPQAAPGRAPARSQSRTWLIIGGFLLLLCGLLAALACVVLVLFPSLFVLPQVLGGPSGGQPEVTPTPGLTAVALTRTPAPVLTPAGPTPTRPPATPTPAAVPTTTLPPGFTVGDDTLEIKSTVLLDGFSDARGGWKEQRT